MTKTDNSPAIAATQAAAQASAQATAQATTGTLQGEHDSAPNPGSKAVFEKDSLWYFHNSAGEQVGPFRYASEAQSNLDRLLLAIRDKVAPQ